MWRSLPPQFHPLLVWLALHWLHLPWGFLSCCYVHLGPLVKRWLLAHWSSPGFVDGCETTVPDRQQSPDLQVASLLSTGFFLCFMHIILFGMSYCRSSFHTVLLLILSRLFIVNKVDVEWYSKIGTKNRYIDELKRWIEGRSSSGSRPKCLSYRFG